MKNIITAIGNQKLNNIMQTQRTINVKGQDIQYQEGIFEALDKHKDIDGIIIKESIIGELDLEDLIRSIVMLRNNIEIILITNQEKQKFQNENIVKIVDNNISYVKEILDYLFKNVYIKLEDETELIEDDIENTQPPKASIVENKIKVQKRNNIRNLLEEVKDRIMKMIKKQKEVSKIITIIGSAGVR